MRKRERESVECDENKEEPREKLREHDKGDDEAEKLLVMMYQQELSADEKLRNAKTILRQLVHDYGITEYASVVPLNLCCDGCHEPFIEEDGFDHFDNLAMCKNCVHLGKEVIEKNRKK